MCLRPTLAPTLTPAPTLTLNPSLTLAPSLALTLTLALQAASGKTAELLEAQAEHAEALAPSS